MAGELVALLSFGLGVSVTDIPVSAFSVNGVEDGVRIRLESVFYELLMRLPVGFG